MAITKKPVQKKAVVKTAKKPVKSTNKPATKKTKAVKPTAKKAVLKTVKKPTKTKTTPMVKVVVDRMPLPKGGKVFVKAAKRPTAKKQAKKAAKKKSK